jgi:hypothetical protein
MARKPHKFVVHRGLDFDLCQRFLRDEWIIHICVDQASTIVCRCSSRNMGEHLWPPEPQTDFSCLGVGKGTTPVTGTPLLR